MRNPARPPACPINAMSVDVEEHFHAHALAGALPRETWDTCPSRVERNTETLLQLFDASGVKATFFTLGWVAERRPRLVRRIVDAGHELASHGYDHTRVDQQTPQAFRADVRRAREILEQAGQVAVRGYRAATFSMGHRTPWAWTILEEEGHAYSSSIYPVAHDLYGEPDAPRAPYRPEGVKTLLEIPISTVRLAGRNRPCGGGGYFRLLPYSLSRAAVRRINGREQRPAIFYIHPWEVDPAQPRPAGLPLRSRIRHYTGLIATESRLRRLLGDFAWGRVDQVFGIEPAPGRTVLRAAS